MSKHVHGASKLTDALDWLWRYQEGVSQYAPDYEGKDGPVTPQHLRDCLLALHVELGELFNALSIKPWRMDHRSPHRYNKTGSGHVTEEFADVIAFTGVLIRLLVKSGVRPHELVSAYLDKSAVNVRRFTEGREASPNWARCPSGEHSHYTYDTTQDRVTKITSCNRRPEAEKNVEIERC
jgi:hypothetical protein